MGLIVPDAVERYLAGLNREQDAVLAEIARAGREEQLPLIDAEVGLLLRVLALACGARRILEIGTAIGYSGMWLAGALPAGGSLITLEIDPERAARARENFARARLAARVEVRIGDADALVDALEGPFDLVYQDGAKELYAPLLDRLADRLRPGGLLVTDNVLWDGEVVPGYIENRRRSATSTEIIARYNQELVNHPRFLTSIVPLRDGVAVSVRR